MFKSLIQIANELDRRGLVKEADALDAMVKMATPEEGHEESKAKKKMRTLYLPKVIPVLNLIDENPSMASFLLPSAALALRDPAEQMQDDPSVREEFYSEWTDDEFQELIDELLWVARDIEEGGFSLEDYDRWSLGAQQSRYEDYLLREKESYDQEPVGLTHLPIEGEPNPLDDEGYDWDFDDE